MRGIADKLRAFRKRRFGMLFSIVAGLMVSLTVAAARAADLALPTDIEINKLFRLVRDDVMVATDGRQEPFTYGSLPGREDYYFVSR
jgi:hypothetical protein